MEISKLKTLTSPNLNDVLPILDINGGVSGKPILRKATLGSLLSIVESGNDNRFTIPTITKTVALSTDYFIGMDGDGLTYKINKADLLAGLSGDSSNGGSGINSVNLTFSSSGDTNGLFYYLGTNRGVTSWSNPSSGLLIVTSSFTEGGNVISLVDRSPSSWFSNNIANSWVGFTLTSGKLRPNYYSIRTRNPDTDYYPRNWILKASNNGTDWTVIDTQVNNIALNSINQWLSLPVNSNNSYSYFQILQNGIDSSGVNYFCLGEVELYGTYYPNGSNGESGASTTIVLLHFNGANNSTVFTDTKGNVFTSNGAVISNTLSKFGGASGLFTGNSISTPSIPSLDFNSTSNFTIEAWIYRNQENTSHVICGKLPQVASQGYSFHIKSNNNLAFESDGAQPNIDSGLTVPINQWVYVGVSKSGNNYTFAVNNNSSTIVNTTIWSGSNRPFTIGANGRGDAYSGYFYGNIDELRISEGALTLAVPAAAFSD